MVINYKLAHSIQYSTIELFYIYRDFIVPPGIFYKTCVFFTVVSSFVERIEVHNICF